MYTLNFNVLKNAFLNIVAFLGPNVWLRKWKCFHHKQEKYHITGKRQISFILKDKSLIKINN